MFVEPGVVIRRLSAHRATIRMLAATGGSHFPEPPVEPLVRIHGIEHALDGFSATGCPNIPAICS
jgi:hypothetical protein